MHDVRGTGTGMDCGTMAMDDLYSMQLNSELNACVSNRTPRAFKAHCSYV